MTESVDPLHRLEILRYDLLPRPHPHSPGHGGVQLVLPLSSTPHELDSVALTVMDWSGRPQRSTVHGRGGVDIGHNVAPGRIYLRRHDELEAAFYTFGARMTFESEADERIVTIKSNAPLLELSLHEEITANLLVAEVEGMLARLEAATRRSHVEVTEGLVQAGSLAFYLAFLQSMLARYRENEVWRRMYPRLIALLKQERDWYRRTGEWTHLQPDLTSLIDSVAAKS